MSELILIEKNGERIEVHPLSLQNHLLLGWTIVVIGPPTTMIASIAVPPVAVETLPHPQPLPKSKTDLERGEKAPAKKSTRKPK